MDTFISSYWIIIISIISLIGLIVFAAKFVPYKPTAKHINDKTLIGISKALKEETGLTPKHLHLLLLKKDLRKCLEGPHRSNVKLKMREDHDRRKLIKFFNEKL